jgi:hypothetical protein
MKKNSAKSTYHHFPPMYEESFIGMTTEKVSYDQLIEVRYKLIELILKSLTVNEWKFLLSIQAGNSEWQLIPITGLKKLPSLKWKNLNIEKMDKEKHKLALDKLKRVLEL